MALVVDGGVMHAPKRKMPPPPLDVAKGPCSEPVKADNLFHANVAVGRGPIGTAAAQCGEIEIEADSVVNLTGMASVGPLHGSSEVDSKRKTQCAVAGEGLSKDSEVFGEQNVGGRELQAW
jgi:hypothetical protein